jgi:hypothetical protein
MNQTPTPVPTRTIVTLRLGGQVVGTCEVLTDDKLRRPADDILRACWYRGYMAGRRDARKLWTPPLPSAGLEEDTEDS